MSKIECHFKYKNFFKNTNIQESELKVLKNYEKHTLKNKEICSNNTMQYQKLV